MEQELSLREEAGLIIGLRLPDDPMQWESFLKTSSISGYIDPNKKWNLTIMLLMRVYELEKKVNESQANT